MQSIRPETIQRAIEEGRGDLVAVTELATILAKEWCEQWGGWPTDNIERVLQIWAHRPQARKMLTAMKKVSKTDCSNLARTLASTRNDVAPADVTDVLTGPVTIRDRKLG